MRSSPERTINIIVANVPKGTRIATNVGVDFMKDHAGNKIKTPKSIGRSSTVNPKSNGKSTSVDPTSDGDNFSKTKIVSLTRDFTNFSVNSSVSLKRDSVSGLLDSPMGITMEMTTPTSHQQPPVR